MARTHTARILSFARRAPVNSPRASGTGPRITRRRTPLGGVEMAVTCDQARLRHTLREREGPDRDEPSNGPSEREDTSRIHDTTTLEALHALLGQDSLPSARFQRDLDTDVRFLVRGRAGALVSTVVGRRPGGAPPLTCLRDVDTYRSIMGSWTWAGLVQAVLATRSYDAGLDAGLLLLRVTDLHHEQIGQGEFSAHRKQLFWLIFGLLDRLDRWRMFVALWRYVRAHTTYAIGLQPRSGQSHDARLAPFILREDARGLTVHFLWIILRRREVIDRKLARQRRGANLGNVWHASQAELSDQDIRERLESVAQRIREAASTW